MSGAGGPGWGLAIDFGTSFTTTVVSPRATLAGPDDRAEVLEIDGTRYVPSLVCLDDDGAILVGRDALNESAMAPDRTERVPKRALVASEHVLLGARTVATVDLVAAVLDRVAGEAIRRFSGRRPGRVVLTHPARWQPGGLELRRLTEAADRVGLGPVELVAEPVAAAHHYVRTGERIPEGGMIGVYDFGGGTFDTAVLRRAGVGFELAGSPGGDVALGGEDLDAVLMEILAEHAEALDPERWNAVWEAEGREAERHRTMLRRDITQNKEALSRQPGVKLWVPGFDDEIRVARREYERAIEPLLARSLAELQDTITRARTTPAELVDVYLTGSSSRTPRVSALLAELLGHLPGMRDDPKAVVALGALATVPGSVSETQRITLPPRRPQGQAPAEPTPPLTPSGIPVAPPPGASSRPSGPNPVADETETVRRRPTATPDGLSPALVAELAAEIGAVAEAAGVGELVGQAAPTVRAGDGAAAARLRLEAALAGVGTAIGTKFSPFPNLPPEIALMVLREGREELGELGRCLDRLDTVAGRLTTG